LRDEIWTWLVLEVIDFFFFVSFAFEGIADFFALFDKFYASFTLVENVDKELSEDLTKSSGKKNINNDLKKDPPSTKLIRSICYSEWLRIRRINPDESREMIFRLVHKLANP